jgi:hypothetical protein
MSEATEIQYNLTINTELARSDIRKLEIVIMRCLDYAERLTGDPNLKKGIAVIQRAITLLRTLQMEIYAVEAALIPGAGWIKMLYAGTAVATAGFSAYDMMRGF